jgi:hypothetical protein
MKFLKVENSTFSDGLVLVKEPSEIKEMTYEVTLRAFVDGQAAEA